MNRGVTVQIGMILILSVCLMAIGLVYIGVKPVIESYVKSTHQREVINVFELMREFVIKIDRGVFSRMIEARMFEGNYFINQTGLISVNNTTIYLYSFIYKNNDEEIAFENGAIFRKINNKVFMMEEPFMISDNNTVRILVVSLYGEGSVAGRGVLRLLFTNLGFDCYRNGNKTLIIKSDYYLGWTEYLQKEDFKEDFTITLDPSNKTVIVNVISDKVLLVKILNIEVDFL